MPRPDSRPYAIREQLTTRIRILGTHSNRNHEQRGEKGHCSQSVPRMRKRVPAHDPTLRCPSADETGLPFVRRLRD